MNLINKWFQGLFTSSDQILPFINEEGKKTLKKVKRKFGETDEDIEENSEDEEDTGCIIQ